MKIEVRPHGREVQRRFETFSDQGMKWSKASEMALSVTVDWPESMRLPCKGDSLHLETQGITGPVERVDFSLDIDGHWSVTVKLG
jgi:hypothetical protein